MILFYQKYMVHDLVLSYISLVSLLYMAVLGTILLETDTLIAYDKHEILNTTISKVIVQMSGVCFSN